MRALDSGWVAPLGPEVDAFEVEVCSMVGTSYAVALTRYCSPASGLKGCGSSIWGLRDHFDDDFRSYGEQHLICWSSASFRRFCR